VAHTLHALRQHRFAFFPILIISFGFIGTIALNVFDVMFSRSDMVLAVHYVFMFFGINVGAFGLGAREFMNRRFGRPASSHTLPERYRSVSG